MRKIIAYFFFFVTCIYLSFSQNSSSSSTKNIFILNSYHITQGWGNKFASGYYPFINNENYNLFIEQLNEKRIPFSPEIGKSFVNQYNTLYKNIHFDLIVALDNSALEFLNSHIDELNFLEGVPIMAAGINFFDSSMISNIPEAMVLREESGIQATLLEAMHLLPQIDTIYCLIDYTLTGKLLQHEVKEEIKQLKKEYKGSNKVTFLFNEDVSFDQIIEEINQLPKNSAVFVILFERDIRKIYYPPDEMIRRVTSSTGLPIFCTFDMYMQEKVIGGKMARGERLGTWLGESIVRFFEGKSPILDVSYASQQLEWTFSYPALKNHTISINTLPDNSKIYFQPVPFLQQYKRISFILLILILITLVVIVIFFIFNKRLSQKVKEQVKNIDDLLLNFDYLRKEMPIGFIELDSQFRIKYWNQSAVSIFGYSPQEALGKNLFELTVLHEDRDKVDLVVENLIKYSKKTYISQFLHHKYNSKESLKCEWFFTQKVNQKDSSAIYMCMVIDITESENLKQEQASLVNMLKSMMLNQDRFIASSMHDIKNIIAPIVAYSEMMVLYDLPQEKIKDLANRLNKSTTVLSNVFVEMMNISKVKGELIQATPSEFNIKELANDIAAMLEESYKRKEITLCNELPNQIIFADYEMIYSLLMNLSTNAVKFTPPHGEVIISGKKISDIHFEVRVQDNGVGIDLEKFNLMMTENKYFTTKGTDGEEGTGLGLLLCKELSINNFGTLRAENNEEKGASFYFTVLLPEASNLFENWKKAAKSLH